MLLWERYNKAVVHSVYSCIISWRNYLINVILVILTSAHQGMSVALTNCYVFLTLLINSISYLNSNEYNTLLYIILFFSIFFINLVKKGTFKLLYLLFNIKWIYWILINWIYGWNLPLWPHDYSVFKIKIFFGS